MATDSKSVVVVGQVWSPEMASSDAVSAWVKAHADTKTWWIHQVSVEGVVTMVKPHPPSGGKGKAQAQAPAPKAGPAGLTPKEIEACLRALTRRVGALEAALASLTQAKSE